MTTVGEISQIWRYPFKSMMGELLNEAQVTRLGLLGDRNWAARDETRGGIGSAKKVPGLMQCLARYPRIISGDGVFPAEITTPDGNTFLTDAGNAAAELSSALGHDLTIWPLASGREDGHYRRGNPTFENPLEELRLVLGLEPGEPLPDLSGFPRNARDFATPPGAYYDAFPIHLITTSGLNKLKLLLPKSQIEARRFRPTLLVDNGKSTESDDENWIGKRLRMGTVVIRVERKCPRCVMTTLASANLGHDTRILRALVQHAAHNFGTYATVVYPGTIARGDTVEVLR